MSIKNKLELLRNNIGGLIRRVNKVEEQILDLMKEFGVFSQFEAGTDEEEEDDFQCEEGWVIVDPNPIDCKGMDHYFTDDGDADEEDASDWSALRRDAKVFGKINQANACKNRLWKEGNVNFKSQLGNNRNRLLVRSI